MRRSTPRMGEGAHGMRAAWTAARAEKSAFTFMTAPPVIGAQRSPCAGPEPPCPVEPARRGAEVSNRLVAVHWRMRLEVAGFGGLVEPIVVAAVHVADGGSRELGGRQIVEHGQRNGDVGAADLLDEAMAVDPNAAVA